MEKIVIDKPTMIRVPVLLARPIEIKRLGKPLFSSLLLCGRYYASGADTIKTASITMLFAKDLRPANWITLNCVISAESALSNPAEDNAVRAADAWLDS